MSKGSRYTIKDRLQQIEESFDYTHEYASVDEEIVFEVIKNDLPRMKEAVVQLLLDY